MNQKSVIVDLDGTLLHREQAELPIPGQTGCSYMSQKAYQYLRQISQQPFPLLIATGRNARSVKKLVDQMSNIHFDGFVMEHGLIARTTLLDEMENQPSPWDEVAKALPEWRQLPGYERCLGIVPPKNLSDAEQILQDLLKKMGRSGLVFRERHKLFVFPFLSDKLKGLQSLNFSPWLMLGNDTNDLEILEASPHVATVTSSAHPKVLALVRRKQGYCSDLKAHQGSEDILLWALQKIKAALPENGNKND